MTPEMLLITFFLFVVAAVSAAGYVFVLRPARAGDGAIPSEDAGPGNDAILDLTSPPLRAPQAAVLDIFERIGDAVPPSIAHRPHVRQLLLRAGFRWPTAVSMFLGIKLATAFTLAVTGVWAAVTFGDGAILLPALGGLGFGFLLPDRVLERLAAARSTRLRRALPAALDLMVLAVEAGQGVDAAILETSRGLRLSYPDLAGEFTQMHLELRAGTSRGDALRDFAARAHDPEVRKFVALMLDTDRFGSSLGPALRTHTHYLRTRFRQKAQEKARKVAVKLIFPVFFLIFPSVILVTLGPAAIMIYSQLGNLMGN
jgi:tight adherence protein C